MRRGKVNGARVSPYFRKSAHLFSKILVGTGCSSWNRRWKRGHRSERVCRSVFCHPRTRSVDERQKLFSYGHYEEEARQTSPRRSITSVHLLYVRVLFFTELEELVVLVYTIESKSWLSPKLQFSPILSVSWNAMLSGGDCTWTGEIYKNEPRLFLGKGLLRAFFYLMKRSVTERRSWIGIFTSQTKFEFLLLKKLVIDLIFGKTLFLIFLIPIFSTDIRCSPRSSLVLRSSREPVAPVELINKVAGCRWRAL